MESSQHLFSAFSIFHVKCIMELLNFLISAVREDRSPGGKHRVKKPRFDSSLDDETAKLFENKQKLDEEHNEVINILLSSNPDRIPDNECKSY